MTRPGWLGDGLVVVTDRAQAAARGRSLAAVMDAAIEGGARTVLLREKDLAPDERHTLAVELSALLRQVDGTLLLVASDVALARTPDVRAAGVHLAASDPWPSSDAVRVVGRSCHTAEDLRSALTSGADYASLSPIWPTSSKPGYGPALGPSGLRAACAAVPHLPVLALGGITTPDRAAECLAAGAAGVMVMGEIMRADEPAERVRELLTGLAVAGLGGVPGPGRVGRVS
jgi:thiamine-phosphate diphosphorylase